MPLSLVWLSSFLSSCFLSSLVLAFFLVGPTPALSTNSPSLSTNYTHHVLELYGPGAPELAEALAAVYQGDRDQLEVLAYPQKENKQGHSWEDHDKSDDGLSPCWGVLAVKSKLSRECLLLPNSFSPPVELIDFPPSLCSPASLATAVLWLNAHTGLDRRVTGELTPFREAVKRLEQSMYRNSHEDECSYVDGNKLSSSAFFHDYASASRPLVIVGGIREWPALTKWSAAFLNEAYGGAHVHVKASPNGDFEGTEPAADWGSGGKASKPIPQAVLEQLESPDKVVVRPGTLDTTLRDFLNRLQTSRASLYIEYFSLLDNLEGLRGDTERPMWGDWWLLDEMNLWLGNGNTNGKLHFDPFDNFLCQVEGSKTIRLFHPLANEDLYEGHIREAFLFYSPSTDSFSRSHLSDSTSMVMSPVDIKAPDFARYPRFQARAALSCTIQKGDILFLPSFWWHEVESIADSESHLNIAVNYWFKPLYNKEFPCKTCRPTFNTYDYSKLLYDHHLVDEN